MTSGISWITEPIAPRSHCLEFVQYLGRSTIHIAIVPSTVSMSFTSDLLAFLSGARCRIGAGSLDGTTEPVGVLLHCSHDAGLDFKPRQASDAAGISTLPRSLEPGHRTCPWK